MSWSWGENLTEFIDNQPSVLRGLSKLVWRKYLLYFVELLPWSIIIATSTIVGNYIFGMHTDFANIGFIWTQSNIILGLFYLQSKMYKLPPSWPLWILSMIPYLVVPALFYTYVSFFGIVFAIYFVVSMAFFVPELMRKDNNIFESYLYSITLTWHYNTKLLLFVLIPWLVLTSSKLFIINSLGVFNLGELRYLLYWLSLVMLLPWLGFAYGVFYDYLDAIKTKHGQDKNSQSKQNADTRAQDA